MSERLRTNSTTNKWPHRHDRAFELKDASTNLPVKQYFYRRVAGLSFSLYSVVLDKQPFAANHLQVNKDFHCAAGTKALPLEDATEKITLTLDRSKGKPAIEEFNKYLLSQLESRIPLQVPLDIHHDYSYENKLIQAVDLFAWSIFRKYELEDTDWYEVFKEKVVSEEVYPRQ